MDYWEKACFAREQKLKFWRFSAKSSCFKLISLIDESTLAPITSLQFQPSERQLSSSCTSNRRVQDIDTLHPDANDFKPANVLCVSAYEDGSFKLWSSVAIQTSEGTPSLLLFVLLLPLPLLLF